MSMRDIWTGMTNSCSPLEWKNFIDICFTHVKFPDFSEFYKIPWLFQVSRNSRSAGHPVYMLCSCIRFLYFFRLNLTFCPSPASHLIFTNKSIILYHGKNCGKWVRYSEQFILSLKLRYSCVWRGYCFLNPPF